MRDGHQVTAYNTEGSINYQELKVIFSETRGAGDESDSVIAHLPDQYTMNRHPVGRINHRLH